MMSEYKILPIDENLYNIPSLSLVQIENNISISNNINLDHYHKLLDYAASTLNSLDSLYNVLYDSEFNFERSQISSSKIIYQQIFSKIHNKICSFQSSVPSPNNLPINPSRFIVKVQAKKIKSEPYPTNSQTSNTSEIYNQSGNSNHNSTILSPKVNKPKLNLTKLDLSSSNISPNYQQAVPCTPTSCTGDRSIPSIYTPTMTPTIAPIAPFTPKFFSSSPLSPTTSNTLNNFSLNNCYNNNPSQNKSQSASYLNDSNNNSLYYLSSAASLTLSPNNINVNINNLQQQLIQNPNNYNYYPKEFFLPSPFELDYNPNTQTKLQYINSNIIDWKQLKVNDFSFLSKVGSGSFGTAILSRHKPSGIYFCTKLIVKSKIQHQKQREHIMNEKSVMMSLSHPFIVPLYATFNTKDYLLFIMEYVTKGDVFTFTRRFRDNLPEQTIKTIVAEIVLAIEYLHKNNIVYRDLKPENILIDEQGHIKLTDFGFAKKLGFQKTTSSVCGSIDYIAPEIVNINNFYFQKNNAQNVTCNKVQYSEPPKGYGKEVDWWSLGILVYELVSKVSPFDSDSKFQINFQKNNQYSNDLEDFVYKLLVVNPEERLGFGINGSNNIKSHPWFNNINWSQIEDNKSHFGPFYNLESFQSLNNDPTKYTPPIDDQIFFEPVNDEFNDFNSN